MVAQDSPCDSSSTFSKRGRVPLWHSEWYVQTGTWVCGASNPAVVRRARRPGQSSRRLAIGANLRGLPTCPAGKLTHYVCPTTTLLACPAPAPILQCPADPRSAPPVAPAAPSAP